MKVQTTVYIDKSLHDREKVQEIDPLFIETGKKYRKLTVYL